jgi:hypothetical protein
VTRVVWKCSRRHWRWAAADRSGYGCGVAVGCWRGASADRSWDRGSVSIMLGLGRWAPADGSWNGRSVPIGRGRCCPADGSVDWVGGVHLRVKRKVGCLTILVRAGSECPNRRSCLWYLTNTLSAAAFWTLKAENPKDCLGQDGSDASGTPSRKVCNV